MAHSCTRTVIDRWIVIRCGLARTYARLAVDPAPLQILGLVVTALLFLQIAIGNSAAHADAPNAHDEDGALAPKPKKRTFLRWVHIAVGIALVTLAGLNVTCECIHSACDLTLTRVREKGALMNMLQSVRSLYGRLSFTTCGFLASVLPLRR